MSLLVFLSQNPPNKDFGELDWNELIGDAVVNHSVENSTTISANEHESCSIKPTCAGGEVYVDSNRDYASVYDDIIKSLNSLPFERKNQSQSTPRILRKRNRQAALRKIKCNKFIACPKFETESMVTHERTPNCEESNANSSAHLRDDDENSLNVEVDVVSDQPPTNWRNVFKRVRQKKNIWRGGRRRKRGKHQPSEKNHVQSKVSHKTNQKFISCGRSPLKPSMQDELENLTPSNALNNSEKITLTQKFKNPSQFPMECSSKNCTSTHQDPFSESCATNIRDQQVRQRPQNYTTRDYPSRAYRDFMNSTVSPQSSADTDPQTYDVKSLLYDLKTHNEYVLDSICMKTKFVDQCIKCGLNLNLKPRLLAKDFLNLSLHSLNCFFCCNSYFDKSSFKSHLGSHILSFLFNCCNRNLGFTLNLNYEAQSVLQKHSSEASRLTDSETKRAQNLYVAKKHSSKVCAKRHQNETSNLKPEPQNGSSSHEKAESSEGSHHYSPEIFETFSLTSKYWDSNFQPSTISCYDSYADTLQNSISSQNENSVSTKDCSESGNSPAKMGVTNSNLIDRNNHSCDVSDGMTSLSIKNIDEKFKTVSDLKPRHFVKLNLELSPVKEQLKSSKLRKLIELTKDELLEHKLRMKFDCLRVPRVVLTRMSDCSIEKACNPSLQGNSTKSPPKYTALDDLKIDACTWKLRVLSELEKFTILNDESKDSDACSFKQCRKCYRKFIKHSQIDSISQFGFLYPCSTCFRYFQIKGLFAQHEKKTHPFTGPFVCHLCNQECKRWFHFVFHMKLHDINRSLCEKCSISVNYCVNAFSQDDLIRCAKTYYDFEEGIEAWPSLKYKKDCAPLQSLHLMPHPSADDILKIIGVEPEHDNGSGATAMNSTEEEVASSSINLSLENLKVRSIMESLPEEEWINLFHDDQKSLRHVRKLCCKVGRKTKINKQYNFQLPKNLETSHTNKDFIERNLPRDVPAARKHENRRLVQTVQGPEHLNRFICRANASSKPGPKSRKRERVIHSSSQQLEAAESKSADRDVASTGPHICTDMANNHVKRTREDTFDSLKLPSIPGETYEKSLASSESLPLSDASNEVVLTGKNKLRCVRSEKSKRKLFVSHKICTGPKRKAFRPKTVCSNYAAMKSLNKNEPKPSSGAENNAGMSSCKPNVLCEAKTDLPHCEDSFETLSVSSLLDYDDDDYDVEGKSSFLDSLNHCKQILDEDVSCAENSNLSKSIDIPSRSPVTFSNESTLSGTENVYLPPMLQQISLTDPLHGLNLLSGIASGCLLEPDENEPFSAIELNDIAALLASLLENVCETLGTDSSFSLDRFDLNPVTGFFEAIDCARLSKGVVALPCESAADLTDQQFLCHSNSILVGKNSDNINQASCTELVSPLPDSSTTWNFVNAVPNSALKTNSLNHLESCACPTMKATVEVGVFGNLGLSSPDYDTSKDNFHPDHTDELRDCNLDLNDEEIALLSKPVASWPNFFSKNDSKTDKSTRSNDFVASLDLKTSDVELENIRGASPVIGYQTMDSNALNDENLSISEISVDKTSESRKSEVSYPKVFKPKVLYSEEAIPWNSSPDTCPVDPEAVMNFRKAVFKSKYWKWRYIPSDLMDDDDGEKCDPPLSSVISSNDAANTHDRSLISTSVSALENSCTEKFSKTESKDENHILTEKNQSKSISPIMAVMKSNPEKMEILTDRSIVEERKSKSQTKNVSSIELSRSIFHIGSKDGQSQSCSSNQTPHKNHSMKKLLRSKLPASTLKTKSFETLSPTSDSEGARYSAKKGISKKVKNYLSSFLFKSTEETSNPHSDLKKADLPSKSIEEAPKPRSDPKNAESLSRLTEGAPKPHSDLAITKSPSEEENYGNNSGKYLIPEAASKPFIESNFDKLNKAGICKKFAHCKPKPRTLPSPTPSNCSSDRNNVDLNGFDGNNYDVEILSLENLKELSLSDAIPDSKKSTQSFSNCIVEVVGFHKLEGDLQETKSNLLSAGKDCQNLNFVSMEVEVSDKHVDDSQNTLSKSNEEGLSSTYHKNTDSLFDVSRGCNKPAKGSSAVRSTDLNSENSRSESLCVKLDELYHKTDGFKETVQQMTGPRTSKRTDDTVVLTPLDNNEISDKLVEGKGNQNQSVVTLPLKKTLLCVDFPDTTKKFIDQPAKVVDSSYQTVESLSEQKSSEPTDCSLDQARSISSADDSNKEFSEAMDCCNLTISHLSVRISSEPTNNPSDLIESIESASELIHNSPDQIRTIESVCESNNKLSKEVCYHNQASINLLVQQPPESMDNPSNSIKSCESIIKSNDELIEVADDDSQFVEDISTPKSSELIDTCTDKPSSEFTDAVETCSQKDENLSAQKFLELTDSLSDLIQPLDTIIHKSNNVPTEGVECDQQSVEDLSAPKPPEPTDHSLNHTRSIERSCLFNEELIIKTDTHRELAEKSSEPTEQSANLMKSRGCVDESNNELVKVLNKFSKGINESDNVPTEGVECLKQPVQDLSAPKPSEPTDHSLNQTRSIEKSCFFNEELVTETDTHRELAEKSSEPTEQSANLMKSRECVDESKNKLIKVMNKFSKGINESDNMPTEGAECDKQSSKDFSASKPFEQTDNSSDRTSSFESTHFSNGELSIKADNHSQSVVKSSELPDLSGDLTKSSEYCNESDNEPMKIADGNNGSVENLFASESFKLNDDDLGGMISNKSFTVNDNQVVKVANCNNQSAFCPSLSAPKSYELIDNFSDLIKPCEPNNEPVIGVNNHSQSVENLSVVKFFSQVESHENLSNASDEHNGETENYNQSFEILSCRKSSKLIDLNLSSQSVDDLIEKSSEMPPNDADDFHQSIENITLKTSTEQMHERIGDFNQSAVGVENCVSNNIFVRQIDNCANEGSKEESTVRKSKPSKNSSVKDMDENISKVHFDSKNNFTSNKEADSCDKPVKPVCVENSVKVGDANPSLDRSDESMCRNEPVTSSTLNLSNSCQNLVELNVNVECFVSKAKSVEKPPLITVGKSDSGKHGEISDILSGLSDCSRAKNQSSDCSKSKLFSLRSTSEIEMGENKHAALLQNVEKPPLSVCSDPGLSNDQKYSASKTGTAPLLKDDESFSVNFKTDSFEPKSAQSASFSKTESKKANSLSLRKKRKHEQRKRGWTKSMANNALSSTLQEVSQIISSLLQNSQSDDNRCGDQIVFDEEKLYYPNSSDKEVLEGNLPNLTQIQDKQLVSSYSMNSNTEGKDSTTFASVFSGDPPKCNSREKSKSSRCQLEPGKIKAKTSSRNGMKNTFVCKGLKNRQLHFIRKKRNGGARKLVGDKTPERELSSRKSSRSLEKVNPADVDRHPTQAMPPSQVDSDTDSVNYNLRLSAHPSRIFPSLKEPVRMKSSKYSKSQNLELKNFRIAESRVNSNEMLPLKNHLKISTCDVSSLPETDRSTSCNFLTHCKKPRRNRRRKKLGKWRKDVVKISSSNETENKAQNSSVYDFDPSSECEESPMRTFQGILSKPKIKTSSILKSKQTQKNVKSFSNPKLQSQKNLRPRSEIRKKLRPRLNCLPLNSLTKSLGAKSPLVQSKKRQTSALLRVSDNLSESNDAIAPASVIYDGLKTADLASSDKSAAPIVLEDVFTQEQNSHHFKRRNNNISTIKSNNHVQNLPSLKCEEATVAKSILNDLTPCKKHQKPNEQIKQYAAENSEFCSNGRKRGRRVKKLRFCVKKKRGQYVPKPKSLVSSPDLNDASTNVKNKNDVQVVKVKLDAAKPKKTGTSKANQRFEGKVAVVEYPLSQSSVLNDTCSAPPDLKGCSDLLETVSVTTKKSKICSDPKKRVRRVKKFRFCAKKKRGQYVPKLRLPGISADLNSSSVESLVSSTHLKTINDVQTQKMKESAMKQSSDILPTIKSTVNPRSNIRSKLRTKNTSIPPMKACQKAGQKVVAFEPELLQNSIFSSPHEFKDDGNKCFDRSKTDPVTSTKSEASSNCGKRKRRVKRLRFCAKKKRGQYVPKSRLPKLPVGLNDLSRESLVSSPDVKNKQGVEVETNPTGPTINDSSPETIVEKSTDLSKILNQKSESPADLENNRRLETPASTTISTLVSNFKEGKTFRANRGSRLKELCLMIRVPGLPRKPKAHSADSSPSTLKVVLNNSAREKLVSPALKTSELNSNSSRKVRRRKRARSKCGRKIQRNQCLALNQSCLKKNVILSTSISDAVPVDSTLNDSEIMEPSSLSEVQSEDFTTSPEIQIVSSGLIRKKRRRKSHTHHLVLRKTPRIANQKQVEHRLKSKVKAVSFKTSNHTEVEEASNECILTTSKMDECSQGTDKSCLRSLDSMSHPASSPELLEFKEDRKSTKNMTETVVESPRKSNLRMIRKRKKSPVANGIRSNNESSCSSVINNAPVLTSEKFHSVKLKNSRSSPFSASDLDISSEINQDSKTVESKEAVTEISFLKPDSAHNCESSSITGSSSRKKTAIIKQWRKRDTCDDRRNHNSDSTAPDSLNSPENDKKKDPKIPGKCPKEKLSKASFFTDHKPLMNRKRKQRSSKTSVNVRKCTKSPKLDSRSSQVNSDCSLSSLDSVLVDSRSANEMGDLALVRAVSDEVVEPFFLKNLPTLKPAFPQKAFVLQESHTDKITGDDLNSGVTKDLIPQTVDSSNKKHDSEPDKINEEERMQNSCDVLFSTTENTVMSSASRSSNICCDYQQSKMSSSQTLRFTSNPSVNASDSSPTSERFCKEKCDSDPTNFCTSDFMEVDSLKAISKSNLDELILKMTVSPLRVTNCRLEEEASSSLSDTGKNHSLMNARQGKTEVPENSPPKFSCMKSRHEEPLTPTKILQVLSDTMSPESHASLELTTEIAVKNSSEENSAGMKVNKVSASKNTDKEFEHSNSIEESISKKSVVFSTPLKEARKKLTVSLFADQEGSSAQNEKEKNPTLSKSLRFWEDSLYQSNTTQQLYDSKQTSQPDNCFFATEPMELGFEFLKPKPKQNVSMDEFKTSPDSNFCSSSSSTSCFQSTERASIDPVSASSKCNDFPSSATNWHPSHLTFYPQSFNSSNENNFQHSNDCSLLPCANSNQVISTIPTFAPYKGGTESYIPPFDPRSLLYGSRFSNMEYDHTGSSVTIGVQRHLSSDPVYRPGEISPDTCGNVKKIAIPRSTSETCYPCTPCNAPSNAVLSAIQESFISNPNAENTYTAL